MMNFNEIKNTEKYDLFMNLLYKCFADAKQVDTENDFTFWYNTVTYSDGIIVFKTGNNDVPEVQMYYDNGFIICKYIFPHDLDLSHCHYAIHGNIKKIIEVKYPKFVEFIKPQIEASKFENQNIKISYGNVFDSILFDGIPGDQNMTISSIYISVTNSLLNQFFEDTNYIDKLITYMFDHNIDTMNLFLLIMGNQFISYDKFDKLFDKYVYKIPYSNSTGSYKIKIYGLKF